MSKSHKIDKLLQLQEYTADGNTRKKNYQCINTILKIVIIRNYFFWKDT